MVTITPGVTFAADDEVTNIKLANLVANSVIADLDSSNFGAASRILTVSPTDLAAPSVGELQFNSTTNTIGYFNENLRRINFSPSQDVELQCQSVGSIGNVVKVDTTADNSCDLESTANSPNVLGVLTSEVASAPSSASVAIGGKASVVCDNNAVARGDYLYSTATAGVATANASLQDGAFARAVTTKPGGAGGSVTALLLGGAPADVVSVAPGAQLMAGTNASAKIATNLEVSGGGWQTISFSPAIDFETTVANELVMVTLTMNTSWTGTVNRIIRFVLNGTGDSNAIAFDSVTHGDPTNGGINIVGAGFVSVTFPFTVAAAASNNTLLVQAFSPGFPNTLTVNGLDGDAHLFVWQNTTTVS